MPEKSAPALFETLEKNLKSEGPELVKRVKVRVGGALAGGALANPKHT